MHSDIDGKDELVEKYKAKLAEMPPHEGPRYVQEGRPRDGSGLGVSQVQENPVFAAMLESVDENVGRLLRHLEELRISEDTVVVFFADNGGQSTGGTAVAGHGVPETVHDTSNAPLRGGKGYLFEGGIREPMIIRWPGITRPGSVCHVPVTSTDFYPTLLEMAGLPLRPEQHLDGVSLLPLLRGGDSLIRDAIFWHMPNYGTNGDFPGSAVRSGSYKLIEFFEDRRVRLYNLDEDVREQNDLSEQMPEKRDELLRMLEEWREEVDAPMMIQNPFHALLAG
jgi:arylsulfatase A-like enzyme